MSKLEELKAAADTAYNNSLACADAYDASYDAYGTAIAAYHAELKAAADTYYDELMKTKDNNK